MSFKTTKTVTFCALLAALAAYIAAAGLQRTLPDSALPMAFALAGTGLLALTVLARLLWAKCPGCGRYVGYKHMRDKACPWCGEALR